ncbi:MAG: flagellar hook-basal body complex protein FliE [Candidatus Wallbacteria bacterium]|nr:flagellar hook-basal body complex protein FliE [Candidatus Wallbacteria bacterium]
MKVIDAWKLLPNELDTRKPRLQDSKQHEIISDFSNAFSEALHKVNGSQIESENKAKQFVAGEIENVHEVMLASEKARMALEFTIEIRNKLLEAYKSIERMTV